MSVMYPTSSFVLRLCLVSSVLAGTGLAHAQSGPYKVLATYTIGGEGGWDYLAFDPAMHRLYIAHNASVDVVDPENGKVVGAISGLGGTHGIALDGEGRYGYISDGKANAIVIFDRHTLQKVASVPAGTNPDGIVYEPVTKTVWAFNGRSGDVSVLDTASRTIVATIALPGKPEFPAADGQGMVFANIEDKNMLVKLDAKTHQLVASYPLTGCDSPSGLAIDRKGRRLFSVCDGNVMAITSADTGKVIATAPIGAGPDADRFDAKDDLAISSNGGTGDMTFVSVRGATPHVLETVKTAPGARTMAFDEATGRAYTVTADFGPKPEPSPSNPRGRAAPTAGTFKVIVVGK